MKRQMLKVDRIDQIQHGIYALTLTGDCSKISAPGQFVNIKLDGFYLRRPISICKYDAASITLLFKVVGQGTKALAERKPGDLLDVLLPLGNGFDIPPLYGLAKALASAGKNPQVVIGFNGADDIILTEEFHALGIEPIVTTADGSVGIKGFVTDAMKALEFDYVYTCGPEPMLKAVYDLAPDGQFSFEARMACGFGACMGCTCETKYGYKRICKDGPVLYKEEIKW